MALTLLSRTLSRKKCKKIMEDVDKLDNIQDCFIHYQLLRFCQAREAYKKWNLQDRAWVDMHLHKSHDEGGFGVPNNTISRHAAAYTTNARFVAFLGTRPPCSGGMAAGQRHPGSHHLERPFPSHAQAPARNSPAGLRLHGAAGRKPARTAGRQRGGKRWGAPSTAARSRPRFYSSYGNECLTLGGAS